MIFDLSWGAEPVKDIPGDNMKKIARQAQATLKVAHISSKDPPCSKTPKIWNSLQTSYKTNVLTSFVSESKFFLL